MIFAFSSARSRKRSPLPAPIDFLRITRRSQVPNTRDNGYNNPNTQSGSFISRHSVVEDNYLSPHHWSSWKCESCVKWLVEAKFNTRFDFFETIDNKQVWHERERKNLSSFRGQENGWKVPRQRGGPVQVCRIWAIKNWRYETRKANTTPGRSAREMLLRRKIRFLGLWRNFDTIITDESSS